MAEILDTRIVHDGWCRLLIARLRLADGTSFGREIEDHGPAVAVLPYDSVRKTALLVRQMRAPVLYASGQTDVLEVPAGIADHGSAEDSARAEALEELGLRLGAIEHVADVWSMPGISTERMSLYLAAFIPDDRVGPGGGVASENERISIVEVPLRELATLPASGETGDMKTLVLTLALMTRRPDLFA
ncbi:NUDIX domain-containing protein [Terrihabitans sp. B22-R8]|uniref:NUDIX domain-containing protein n=1 Tax=Terrihabitans sp. B22-R8 TaxID=3425128 RepID=UPI00403C9F0A